MSQIQNYRLKDIGNVLKLRDNIDPGLRVTKHIRANLATVDIIPVDFNLRLDAINLKKKHMAVSYDFITPMSIYSAICKHYDLEGDYGGVRLWLTDETQASEDFTQNFDNNIIETGINTLSGMGQQMRQILKSTGQFSSWFQDWYYNKASADIGNFVSSTATNLGLGGIENKTDTGGSSNVMKELPDIMGGAAKTAASIVLQGKQISLPRIWKSSDYKPSFTMNLKLISPYGSPEAIKQFITGPLMYLQILSSPRSSDGLSYGLYQPVRIKGYGMANINLAAITNIQIRRGGRETAYNVYKQPLIIEVAISAIPLSDGFAVMEPGSMTDIATFNDASIPYAENATETPTITTLGNIIQSLRPAPDDVVNQNAAQTAVQTNPDFPPSSAASYTGPPNETVQTTESANEAMQ